MKNQIRARVEVNSFVSFSYSIPVKWLWESDKGWVEYSNALTQKIEKGYQNDDKVVKIDDERFVDLPSMFQRRYDDTSKVRNVKREDSNANKKQKVVQLHCNHFSTN